MRIEITAEDIRYDVESNTIRIRYPTKNIVEEDNIIDFVIKGEENIIKTFLNRNDILIISPSYFTIEISI